MAAAIYVLGAFTSLAVGILLLRGYSASGKRLLFWSGLCFLGMALSNILVFLDLVLFPGVDLYGLRLGTAAVSMLLLVIGLIRESE